MAATIVAWPLGVIFPRPNVRGLTNLNGKKYFVSQLNVSFVVIMRLGGPGTPEEGAAVPFPLGARGAESAL